MFDEALKFVHDIDWELTWNSVCDYYKQTQHNFSNDEYNLVGFLVAFAFAIFWLIVSVRLKIKNDGLVLQLANVKRIDEVCNTACSRLVPGCCPTEAACNKKDCVELVIGAHMKLLNDYDNANARYARFMNTQLEETLVYLEAHVKRFENMVLETDPSDEDEDSDE